MIDDGKKYAILKTILQSWDQTTGNYRSGFSDAEIARAVGLVEADIRIIRWETVGETLIEREKRKTRHQQAQEVVTTAAQNLDHLLKVVNDIAADAEGYSETWSQITTVADGLATTLKKMPDALEMLPSRSLELEAIAYTRLASLWLLLSDIKPTGQMRRSLLSIGSLIGWAPSESGTNG